MSHAWCAMNVIHSATWEAANAQLRPTARMWARLEIPDRLGITSANAGKKAGIAIVARTNVVHTSGRRLGSVQPATSVSHAAGAESVRRRLSTIFH